MKRIGQSFLSLYTLFWDWKLGVHTRGRFEDIITTEENYGYSTLSYKQIFIILKYLKIGANDVFYDLGCGRGRVLCAAQVFKPGRIVGVEINPKLAEIAKGNLEKMQEWKSPFEIIRSSAAECDFRDATIFYIYNPFGEELLGQVLQNIHKSLALNPRKIKIAYVHANFNERLEKCDWLVQTGLWKRDHQYPFIPFSTFWESKTS